MSDRVCKDTRHPEVGLKGSAGLAIRQKAGAQAVPVEAARRGGFDGIETPINLHVTAQLCRRAQEGFMHLATGIYAWTRDVQLQNSCL